MGLDLHVALQPWQSHLDRTAARLPGLVPVAKGNGYGFGLSVLAEQAQRLGGPVLAVGTASEAARVGPWFRGDVLVLQPWRPGPEPDDDVRACPGRPTVGGRLLRTVAHLDVLARLADGDGGGELDGVPWVVVEMDSPLHRHGIGWRDLALVRDLVRRIPFAGIGLHLPLTGDRFGMALEAARALAAAGVAIPALWMSHLDSDQAAALHRAIGTPVRNRVGTSLWLGDPSTYRAQADVLDCHALPLGSVLGYRGRRLLRPAQVVVVAGGTSHGVGVRGSVAGHPVAGRWRAAAIAGLEAAGMARSPFSWRGQRLSYADSPHMQVSMVYAPRGVDRPRIGNVMDVTARMTMTVFDNVVFTDDDAGASAGGRGPLPGPRRQAA